ncbi:MAG: hypothetical protein A2W91_03240 [Bacteroidetes bacterium GWF2_38_335]|nr:MAG: hypothetical protein A2W91_03240 [Bacteroidetes bacterium GWF2_38_335]OFY77498.1 MAG: hypothetical protein A2281_01520 [Bacteroidetes bacterium RIFOXYA12_FULL_38_20]HBS87209.1 hypothetical protein [Bacteroidales bacterium]
MNEMEDLIRKNIGFLNEEEPADGHLERFEKKLIATQKKKSRFTPVALLKIAAVFTLLIMSALWMYDRFSTGNEKVIVHDVKTLSDVSGEYNEVEFYYTSQIDRKYDEIENTAFPGDEKEKQMLLNELSQMDSVYQSLQKELNAHPKDDRVINAMINYYKTKLKIMNQIIDQLNEYKQSNNIKNESTEI